METSEDDEPSDDGTVGTENGKKRKRSEEKHTRCHCRLFQVPDDLFDFMAGGQPYHRFKADQIKRRDSAKVVRVILLQSKSKIKPSTSRI